MEGDLSSKKAISVKIPREGRIIFIFKSRILSVLIKNNQLKFKIEESLKMLYLQSIMKNNQRRPLSPSFF
jgi:hypothetical protein